MNNQTTISKKITLRGIGVHTGKKVNLNIHPAPPNSGITFKRIDLQENNIIYPIYNNVIDTTLCTTISNDYGVKVAQRFLDDLQNIVTRFLVVTGFSVGIGDLVADNNTNEQIKKYQFLPEPLSIKRGELTPKMSVKRKVVSKSYVELIEKIYSD